MKTPIDWTHLHPKYSGQWVAFAADEKTIISASEKFTTAIRTATKQGIKHPIMFKVPQNPVAYVGQV